MSIRTLMAGTRPSWFLSAGLFVLAFASAMAAPRDGLGAMEDRLNDVVGGAFDRICPAAPVTNQSCKDAINSQTGCTGLAIAYCSTPGGSCPVGIVCLTEECSLQVDVGWLNGKYCVWAPEGTCTVLLDVPCGKAQGGLCSYTKAGETPTGSCPGGVLINCTVNGCNAQGGKLDCMPKQCQ